MRKKYFKRKIQNFQIFFCCPISFVLSLLDITFVPGYQLGKNLCSHEANQFFYLQEKFQKIMIKIETVGTHSKSNLSVERTMVLLGVK